VVAAWKRIEKHHQGYIASSTRDFTFTVYHYQTTTAKMGCMNSKPSYIDSEYVAGGEKEYQERFLETKTLGEGEFGVVKLVHDQNENVNDMSKAKLAVKYLRKGYTFKDNTLFAPLKKEMLQGEVEILRRLNGEVREGEVIDQPLP